jgi:hypothetical protein
MAGALFGLTGGLAVAHALPAPMQDAMSKVGIGEPAHRHARVVVAADTEVDESTTTTGIAEETTTTVVSGETTTTVADGDGDGTHGDEVSAVAKDKTLQGCEHGRAVSAVASGTVNDKPCPHTTTTIAGGESTTTDDVGEDPGPPGNADGNGNSGKAKGNPHN